MSDNNDMQADWQSSFLFGGNASYLEELYEAYLRDPNSVGQEWRERFDSLPGSASGEPSTAAIREYFLQLVKQPKTAVVNAGDSMQATKQAHVSSLINAYRSHGHHEANLDPLNLAERRTVADLSLSHHQLDSTDGDKEFATNSFKAIPSGRAKLNEIVAALKATYSGTMGIEYMHITDPEQRAWIQDYLETRCGEPGFSADEKKQILKDLTGAEGLAKYLGSRYVGQKRFGIEGGESLLPMLQDMVQRSGNSGVKEFVIGMAHRGRLNVLVNVLGKAPGLLFEEFEGKLVAQDRSGDVKYHLGFSSDVKTAGGVVHLTLGFNPSHLEIISPVIEGSVRARQDRRGGMEVRNQVLPVVIHGDAAVAGQGVVMETLNMSQARGYCTAGTVHIVINNQIGFTTSNPLDSRSTLYCTDVMKIVQAPVIHVNGDDPEAVVLAGRLAFDFRQRFKKDVVIDLVCYRRHGHNEADEPSGTQPIMYRTIKSHPTTLKIYGDKLIADNIISQADVKAMVDDYRNALDQGAEVVALEKNVPYNEYLVDWSPFLSSDLAVDVDTTIPMDTLMSLGKSITTIPQSFALQAQVAKEYENRRKMLNGEMPVFWGMAEALAYASLVDVGNHLRLSGQDSGRGTFSHRHAVLHNHDDGTLYVPLQHVSANQGNCTIIDSVLSEEAVLAFEYGYSTAEPNALVIWEAQFGDFVNGAQVVIDQFISSGEQKWGRLCGLVMFLPHGYEGMGPEHSSARLERFLQLCAEYNMRVCMPTTPAQCFHMLRRQMLQRVRKPLIVMTPKSLLRNKLAVSTMEELANGQFHLVLPEIDNIVPHKITRVICCSGKVYYDVLQQRRDSGREDVAIIRAEQLYPFPEDEIKQQLALYPNAKDIVWCQEEPKNQGAWYSSQHHLRACLQVGQELHYAGRAASAAPAAGHLSLHQEQQTALVKQALGN
ncbi:MAG: 2-oxoglutarate dehydrogenase E1 component [Legionellales bacterium]|nr:2-oxoglutarate dehydrogenase E1 component [Legionellales bacterium]|tara:strand:- start:6254 stop:9070 length:2817 start_codon:yes stop_codon:yes gene_type:complete